ncbi:hypothetical protein JG688_00006039, partial [Phytophthora aleatoria]
QYYEEEGVEYGNGSYAMSDYYPVGGVARPGDDSCGDEQKLLFGDTDEVANVYKGERGLSPVYWDGVERDEVNTVATNQGRPLNEGLATLADVVEREILLATDSGPSAWESPEFGEQETAVEAVVVGNLNVSEAGSQLSTAVAVGMNTTMATSMGVGVVSVCDT